MQVIEETPSKLVLQQKWSRGQAIMGLFFALTFACPPLSAVGGFFNLGVTAVECQRVEPTLINCSKSESKLLGLIHLPASSLRNVKKAEYNLKTYTDGEGDTYKKYWVSVMAKGREVIAFRGDSREMNAIATKINRFINSNEPSLIVRQDRRWRLSNLGLLFFLFFLVPVIVMFNGILQIQTWTFDKNSQNLRYKKKNLLGIKNRCHQFGNIAKVEVEEYLDDDDKKCYKLSLLLPSASTNYLLMPSYDGGLPEMEKMAQKLSDFLGIPVNHKSPKKT